MYGDLADITMSFLSNTPLKETKEDKGVKETKEDKEGKETKEGKEGKEIKEDKEGTCEIVLMPVRAATRSYKKEAELFSIREKASAFLKAYFRDRVKQTDENGRP